MELLISRGEEFQIFKLMCKSHRVKAPVEAFSDTAARCRRVFLAPKLEIFVYFVTQL